ncbi:hypothetical protein Cantr_01690 [Candida viswanathii]|uniref:Uncharacterized protein n=1 Tax=Candida viswanathii TaxID=5486 RepID=A0A367YJF5_9ASCO|nr:hypothetical protein Cantr_01690 [Candida viswanathii]
MISPEQPQIPIKTIARLFKELSFTTPESTRITLSTLELSSEYIKLFINEAIIRANEERVDEGDALGKVDGIDYVTTQYPDSQEITGTQGEKKEEEEEVGVELGEGDDDDDVDVDDFDEDDYYDEISNSQRQLAKLDNGSTANNRLDSRHLQKIAGVLVLDF